MWCSRVMFAIKMTSKGRPTSLGYFSQNSSSHLPERLKMSSRKWTNFRLYLSRTSLISAITWSTVRLRTYFALVVPTTFFFSAWWKQKEQFIGQPRWVTKTLRSLSR